MKTPMQVNAIILKIALPSNLSAESRKALNEARRHKALEESYDGTGASLKTIIESFDALSDNARRFMSRAVAERKWAYSGKIYPYIDDLTDLDNPSPSLG